MVLKTNDNKAKRKLILEINSAKTNGELYNVSRKIRRFVEDFSKRYSSEETRRVSNELYKIEIERKNNLLKWKNIIITKQDS